MVYQLLLVLVWCKVAIEPVRPTDAHFQWSTDLLVPDAFSLIDHIVRIIRTNIFFERTKEKFLLFQPKYDFIENCFINILTHALNTNNKYDWEL